MLAGRLNAGWMAGLDKSWLDGASKELSPRDVKGQARAGRALTKLPRPADPPHSLRPRCAGVEDAPRVGLGRQVQLLFGRSWRQVTRDKPTNIGRAMSQISSAMVFAAIYWRMGR